MTVCGTHPSCKYYSVYTDEPGSITVEMSPTSKATKNRSLAGKWYSSHASKNLQAFDYIHQY